VAYLPAPDELREMLEAAGFVHVHRRRLAFGSVQIVTATRAPTTRGERPCDR